MNMKTSEYFSKIKKSAQEISHKIFYQEILLEGQEPAKFYAYEKKFIGLYGIFLFYSFGAIFLSQKEI